MTPFFVFARNLLRRARFGWGRDIDKTYTDESPDHNPDAIDRDSDGQRPVDVARNPFVKAGLRFRDTGRLFVTANGIDPQKDGSYHPAQLIYPPGQTGSKRVLKTLADQYDTGFAKAGGFGSIWSKHQQRAIERGRSIAEIAWERVESGKYAGKVFASDILSHDPSGYVINPPKLPPGIYKPSSTYATVTAKDRMPDGSFFVITYDSIYENPYGQGVGSLLATMTESWDRVFDAWRQGLVKAGLGSWIGKYGPSYRGTDDFAKQMQKLFLKEMKGLRSDSITVTDKDNDVESQKLELEAEAFLEFHNAFVQAVSVLLTGSSTALSEGKYGTYTALESTGIREKSILEIEDAVMWLGPVFSYHFNRRFCNFNFPNVEVYPVLQLIDPMFLMPTTPEKQKTQATAIGISQQGQPYANQHTQPSPESQAPAEMQAAATPKTPPYWYRLEEQARQHVLDLPLYGEEFDDLPLEERRQGFTMHELARLGDQGMEAIAALRELIVTTMRYGNDQLAWDIYAPQAKNILEAYQIGFTDKQLRPSFEYARQTGYNLALDDYIASRADDIVSIQFKNQTVSGTDTPDDRVRPEHLKYHNITRPVDDPIWQRLRPPLEENCRCYRKINFHEDADKPEVTPFQDLPSLEKAGVWGEATGGDTV